MGKFVHDCENEMFCESINTKIPYFNAPIYLENKVHILWICRATGTPD
jgi:H/ACA ribonucleoprotein complex subunit 1